MMNKRKKKGPKKVKKEQKKQANSPRKRKGCYLPQDIVYNILLRLPAKSLFRFKCVCKHWCNTISDPDFKESNVQHSMSKITIIYQVNQAESAVRYASFKLDDKGTRAEKEAPLRLKCGYEAWTVGSCDNLLLFRTPDETKLYIYDAISHEQTLIPKIPHFLSRACLCSLAYDASRRKYKVVMLRCAFQPYYFIYTLSNQNQWKSTRWATVTPPCPRTIIDSCSPIALNGVLYWAAAERCFGSPIYFIQPMEVSTGEFKQIISLPRALPSIDFEVMTNCYLLKMKGSLCLMHEVLSQELVIWVLKDSVRSLWIKQHKISLTSMVHRPSSLRSFHRHRVFNPYLILETCDKDISYMLVCHDRELYWYNMKTRELRRISVQSDSVCYPIIGFSH